jgi:DNA-binding NarL/FixJ family response regulator
MSENLSDSTKQIFLVVDDHEAILEGTVPALQRTYPGAEVLTASDIQMAQLQIGSHPPVLVVLDQPFQGDLLDFLDLASSSNRAVETCGLFF